MTHTSPIVSVPAGGEGLPSDRGSIRRSLPPSRELEQGPSGRISSPPIPSGSPCGPSRGGSTPVLPELAGRELGARPDVERESGRRPPPTSPAPPGGPGRDSGEA